MFLEGNFGLSDIIIAKGPVTYESIDDEKENLCYPCLGTSLKQVPTF